MSRSLAERQAAEAKGRRAERLAAWWLRLKGWSILDRRVKLKGGEIDLIAKKRGILAFIEVKYRSRADDAAFPVDEYRLRRVAAAAEAVAHRYLEEGMDYRIDVIIVTPGRMPQHLENVWLG